MIKFCARITVLIFVILIVGCGSKATPTSAPPTATPTFTPTSTARPSPSVTATSVETDWQPVSTATPTPKPPTPTLAPTITRTPAPQVSNEIVRFVTEDNVTLSGNLVGEGGGVAVILSHMMGSTRSTWLSFAKLIAAKGFTALAFDFRGWGSSGGGHSYSRQSWDILAAVEFLRERGYERIVCVGASMGGTGCVEAALLGADFEGLVFISGEINLTEEEAASLLMPKLFICEGGAPDPGMKAAYDLLPEPKAFKAFSVNAHATNMFNSPVGDEFRQLLLDFLLEIP